MKTALTVFPLLTFSITANAQTNTTKPPDTAKVGSRGTVRICTASRNRLLSAPPLYVIYAGDKLICRTDTVKATTSPLNVIKQEDIVSIEILKDSVATAQFKAAGKNGVIIIRITEKASVSKELIKALSKDKP